MQKRYAHPLNSYPMELGMRRCTDLIDCGYDNWDSDLFCRACMLPLLNTQLAGRYMIDALLSKGGYAAVFRGIDQNLSRRIAIKVLLPSKTTPIEREHFLREARIAATLDHPNIAPILDYGKDGPSVFLVMPLYTAGSLRTRLMQANGPLQLQEAIHNFHQLAHALYYAHTRPRPVIHRDIKPENILQHQEDYRLVLTDFGIARALEPGASIGQTVTVRGTIGYMAPEQANGIVDPRSDQYGCAIVLYEMLTGYHPLDPTGNGFPPVSSLNLEPPPTLDRVLSRALAPRSDARYADMLEFMRAFDSACRPTAKMHVIQKIEHEESPTPQVRMTNTAHTPTISPSTNKGQIVSIQRTNLNGEAIREKCRDGDQYLKQQQYLPALQAYEEALRLDSLNFHAWNGKGTALYKQGNYRKALEAYQRATEIEPSNAVAWASAGLALNRLQRYQQALVHFGRALAIDPQYVAAWNGKADAQMDLSLPKEAHTSYERALAIDANNFHAWNGLGNARSCLYDLNGAIEAYTHALLVNPRSPIAWCNKAEVLIRLGHNKAALDALNEATELERNYTRAWELKVQVYGSLGNPQEAEKARRRSRPWGLKN